MDIPDTVTEAVTFITEVGYMMLTKSFTDDLAWKVQRELVYSYFGRTEGVQEVTNGQPAEVYLEAARIMATVPYSKREVVNVLKHLIPDIDAGATTEKSPRFPQETRKSLKSQSGKEFYKQGVPVDTAKLKKAYEAKQGEKFRR